MNRAVIGDTVGFSTTEVWSHYYVNVVPGDSYLVTAKSDSPYYYLIAYTDANDVVISHELVNGTQEPNTFVDYLTTVPDGASKLYVTSRIALAPSPSNASSQIKKLHLNKAVVTHPKTIHSYDTPWASAAHRGATTAVVNGSTQTVYEENTVEAIYNAYLKGAAWVEIDVRKTSDNKLVIWHDPTITGTVDGVSTTYTIASETLATLKTLLLGYDATYKNHRIATLDEALKLIYCLGMNANLDCKVGEHDAISKAVVNSNMSGRVAYATNSLESSPVTTILQNDINAMFLFAYIDMANIPAEAPPERTFVYITISPTAEKCAEIKNAGYLLAISELSYMNFETWLVFNPLYAEFKTDANLDTCNRLYIMSQSIYGD